MNGPGRLAIERIMATYEEAQRILGAVGQVEDRIRQGAGEVSGHLKVNAASSFGQMVIAPMLPTFLERHPELKLTLSLDDRVVDMIEGGFDVSIRIRLSMPDSALVARRIGTMRQRIFASPEYLRAHGTPDSPEALKAHRIIGFLLAYHLTQWTLTGNGGVIDLSLDPAIRVGNSMVLRDLLIAGQGIGTLPDFISDPEEANGTLVRVLPAYELPAPEIFAVTGSRLGIDARVSAFLDHLASALRS